jgi:CopG family nickel-responsive transcriptional regulator
MSQLVRLSLSLEASLFKKLEKLVKKSGYTNRSEFVRDLVRKRIVETEWDSDGDVIGTITLIYDHHRHQLAEKLIEIGHRYHHEVLVTTHVHLDHHLCAEVILVRGRSSQIRKFTDQIQQQKGVLHVELAATTTGDKLR